MSRGANEPLLEQYQRIRQHALDICAPLAVDDYGVQPVPDVSPPKWHLAHTSWFFETFLLKPQLPGYRAFDDAFEYLFNSYYNGVGAQHPRTERGHLSRPTVDQVMDYRAHVDGSMSDLLTSDACVEEAVVLGLQHEQQHQELLVTDIKYILGQAPVQAAYQDVDSPVNSRPVAEDALVVPNQPLTMLPFAGGLVDVGTDAGRTAAADFCFDNETPRHKVWLEPFRLANRLVNNGEYRAFIEDGGYQRSDLWLSEGWAALQSGRFGQEPAPLYWRKTPAGWQEYRLTGSAPLQTEAAVSHLSYYEADAYARWAGKRLPREAEWELAANAAHSGSGGALLQVDDALWQWTESAYLPYPGFQPLPGTLGEYNGKFMSGQMVLRGGSVATPAGHARTTYRNFFYPPDRWQYTGLRLASDEI